jgi:hypothetical protein
MRKVMLLAAMLAMALAAAAPAFGQGFVNQEADQFGVVDDSVCSQVFNIAVQQYNAGDQTAVADADADADATAGPFGTAVAAAVANANAANIANAVGIDVDTVNVCLNNFSTVAADMQYKKTVTPTAKTVHAKKTAHAKKTVTPKATAHAKKKVVWIKGKKHFVVHGKTVTATAKATATAKTLPETGGASLLALGAGALLVGGGLVARRLAR